MSRSERRRLGLFAAIILLEGAVFSSAWAGSTTLADLDLTKAFEARSAWRFTAVQGPPVKDEFGTGADEAPGAVRLCLRKGPSAPCDPALKGSVTDDPQQVLFAEPHYLNDARVVRPRGASGRPLLLVQASSLHSGDGDQLVTTQVLAYQPGRDQFVRVYHHSTGHNNNQETRYVDAGPLKGDIVAVDPTRDAPFGFWVVVNALSPAGAYRPVLRYRSATRYGDGNPLAVIDSEMPEIQRRLGLWRPGLPLPVPARACPKPHLIRAELRCG